MLCESSWIEKYAADGQVLILVLLEYALRDDRLDAVGINKREVLILVLLEYALRARILTSSETMSATS